MNILNLKFSLRERLLSLRNLDRMVNDQRFNLYFEEATEIEKKIILRNINNMELNSIKEWFYRKIKETNIRELKKVASNLQINGYSRMSKEDLLREIEKCRLQRLYKNAENLHSPVELLKVPMTN